MKFIKSLRRALVLWLVVSVAAAQAPASTISPLLQGVLGEDIAAVRVALEEGGNPNTIDSQVKHAPLHVAVAPGGPRNPDIVELLGQRGANLNLEDPELHLTPLMVAMVVKDYGPFGVVERARSNVLVEQLLKLGAGPDSAVDGGVTPLMFAAATNNLPAMRLLLAKGAKPNLQNAQGATALHAAYPPGGSPQAIALLRASGANADVRDEKGLKPGELPPTPAPVPALVATPATKPDVKPVSAAADSSASAAPAKSGWNKWLVGGAVVAATIVGAVVLDAYVKDQKKKGPTPFTVPPLPALPPRPTPVVTPTPPPVQTPVCLQTQILQNGACVTVPLAAARIKDLGILSVRRIANPATESFVLGTPAEAGPIEFVEGDSFVLYLDVDDKISQPVTVQLTATEPNVFPLPTSIVVQPNPPSFTSPAACRMRSGGGGCPQYRLQIPVRVGNLEWAHTVDAPNRHHVTITATLPSGSKTVGYTVAHVVAAPKPTICVLPQVSQNGVCVTPTPVCVLPQVLQGGVCLTPPPVPTPPAVIVSPEVEIVRAWFDPNPIEVGKTFQFHVILRNTTQQPLQDVYWRLNQLSPFAAVQTGSVPLLSPNVLFEQATLQSGRPDGNMTVRPAGSYPFEVLVLHLFGGRTNQVGASRGLNLTVNPIVCQAPKILQNGLCVAPLPICNSAQVLQNGACVTPLPVCVQPQVLQGSVCVTQPPICTAPQVLQNGSCVIPLPVCVQPQVLQGNVCVTPLPVCVAPQVLKNRICVTPTPPVAVVITPDSISATPVDFESLLRTVFSDGPKRATVAWNAPAGAVVTDVALMFNWACQVGTFQLTTHATPAPGATSATVDFSSAGNNGTAIPCPENGISMREVAPVFGGIRLTYKANGAGPDLYVVKPYGQAPCRLYYPSTIQFPMVFEITETWRNAGNFGKYNHTIPNPISYADWMGMASRMVFKSCNGQFVSASATKYEPPTASEAQAFSRVVEASNGLITYTFRATRTGSTVDEDTTFVFQYRIATGDYTFMTAGGQRVLENGNTSTVSGNRSGKVSVSVGGALP